MAILTASSKVRELPGGRVMDRRVPVGALGRPDQHMTPTAMMSIAMIRQACAAVIQGA